MMKRESILDLLEKRCDENLLSLYHQFKEEIKDFFYKYDLFQTDNLYLNIFKCLESKEYMSYPKISDHVTINTKGVIKIVNKIENFLIRILEFPRYQELKKLVSTIS